MKSVLRAPAHARILPRQHCTRLDRAGILPKPLDTVDDCFFQTVDGSSISSTIHSFSSSMITGSRGGLVNVASISAHPNRKEVAAPLLRELRACHSIRPPILTNATVRSSHSQLLEICPSVLHISCSGAKLYPSFCFQQSIFERQRRVVTATL